MIAVIFEVIPANGQRQEYFELAADLKPLLETIEGFVSVERFQSLSDPSKILSLSFFANEQSLVEWRNTQQHRDAQAQGRAGVFSNYRLRIAAVKRDYGFEDREQAPLDSRRKHG